MEGRDAARPTTWVVTGAAHAGTSAVQFFAAAGTGLAGYVMSIVACSTCGARLRAPDDAAGRRFKCSQCGGVIVAPGEPMAMLAAAAHGLGVAAGASRPARVRGRPAEASVAVRPAPP